MVSVMPPATRYWIDSLCDDPELGAVAQRLVAPVAVGSLAAIARRHELDPDAAGRPARLYRGGTTRLGTGTLVAVFEPGRGWRSPASAERDDAASGWSRGWPLSPRA